MNMLWESVKTAGGILGQAAKETGLKGKLQTELLLCSREIDSRKRKFGEELYDYVVRRRRRRRRRIWSGDQAAAASASFQP